MTTTTLHPYLHCLDRTQPSCVHDYKRASTEPAHSPAAARTLPGTLAAECCRPQAHAGTSRAAEQRGSPRGICSACRAWRPLSGSSTRPSWRATAPRRKRAVEVRPAQLRSTRRALVGRRRASAAGRRLSGGARQRRRCMGAAVWACGTRGCRGVGGRAGPPHPLCGGRWQSCRRVRPTPLPRRCGKNLTRYALDCFSEARRCFLVG